MPPAVAGPPCKRCAAPLRIVLDGDLALVRCVPCRHLRVFAPETSPWTAIRAHEA